MGNYILPEEGQLTKWDTYFTLYLAMLHARDQVEFLKNPDAKKVTYDFILSC